MSKPILLQDTFTGAYQDLPRHQLPKGKVWNMIDMIPDQASGTVTTRGGWTRSYSAMSATSSSYAAAVGFAPFSGNPTVLGFDEDGLMYKWYSGAPSITSVGAAYAPAHPPTYYRDLSIILDPNGSSAPKKYDGTTLAALSGSPPSAAVSCIYKDHLVLGYGSSTRNRVWFSNAGDPQTWDTAASGQWLDCTSPVMGLATLRNMILVFQEGYTERLRGDIIPGVVGSDFVREPLFQVGCADPASIAVADDYVIFANGSGIYLTDGIGVVNLAKQCGMSSWWSAKLAGYDTGVSIAGVLWKDWYIFSVSDNGTFSTAGMIYIPKRQWVTLSNIHTGMMVGSPVGSAAIGSEFLFMAEREAPRISLLSAIFDSATSDGDGDAVLGVIETPYYMGSQFKKRWKNLYVTARSSSTLAVSRYSNRTINYSAGAETYTAVATVSFGSPSRKRIPLNVPLGQGHGFKIAQSTGSNTILYALEADVYEAEGSR